MSYSAGTKVTTDPEGYNNPKYENPGTVTSDSLAAESIRDGESFAADSDSRGPNSQPSYSTTTNNDDTSSATVLDAAPDAEARRANEDWGEQQQLNAGSGLGKDAGVGPTYNTNSSSRGDYGSSDNSYGSSGNSRSGNDYGSSDNSYGSSGNSGSGNNYGGSDSYGSNDNSYGSGTSGSGNNYGGNDSYGSSDSIDRYPGSGQGAPAPSAFSTNATGYGQDDQPRGKNLQEGGFDDSAPNASYNTDIGGKNDPGRRALNDFQESDVPVAGGAGPRQSAIDGENPYDDLGNNASS